MASHLPQGKKLVIEMTDEGFRNVWFKNKWGDFLAAGKYVGLEKSYKFPKGVVGYLVEDNAPRPDIGRSIAAPRGTVPLFSPVTEADKARAAELNSTVDIPDTEGLPPFEPFPFDETLTVEDDHLGIKAAEQAAKAIRAHRAKK